MNQDLNDKEYKKEMKMQHKKRLRSVFTKVSLLAMLLIVSTYAWFTSQKDITLSNIRGTVEVVENMEISLDAKTWYQKIDLADAENVFADAQASRNEALGETASQSKSTALAIIPEQLFPVSGVGKTGTDVKLLPLYAGEATSTSLSGIAQCEEEGTDPTGTDIAIDNGYIAFDIYIKNTSRDDEADILQLNVNSSAQVLTETINKTITDVTGNIVDRTYNGNDASGLQNTIRVALAKYEDEVDSTSTQVEILNATKDADIGDIAIWEPNAYDHVESIVSNNNKLINGTNTNKIEFTAYHPETALETYALNENAVGQTIENVYNVASTGLGAQNTFKTDNIKNDNDEIESYRIYTADSKPLDIKNIGGNDFEIAANTITRYRVYVWLEGQDVDCINMASLGGGIELDLGLTKDDEVGDVLTNLDNRIAYSTLETTKDPVTVTITMDNVILVLPEGWEYTDGTKLAIKKEYDENKIEQVEIETEDGKTTKVEVTVNNIDESDKLKIKFVDITTGEVVLGGAIEVYSDSACTDLVLSVDLSQEYNEENTIEPGTYYVKVTRVPGGYNTVEEILTQTIVANQVNEWEILINKGTLLPTYGWDFVVSFNGEGKEDQGDYLGSLTIKTYMDEGVEVLEGREVEIHRVASNFNGEGYSYEGEFVDCQTSLPILTNFETTQRYVNAASLIYNTIAANSIVPIATMVSDANGNLIFDNLEKGLYLVAFGPAQVDDTYINSQTILVEVRNGRHE